MLQCQIRVMCNVNTVSTRQVEWILHICRSFVLYSSSKTARAMLRIQGKIRFRWPASAVDRLLWSTQRETLISALPWHRSWWFQVRTPQTHTTHTHTHTHGSKSLRNPQAATRTSHSNPPPPRLSLLFPHVDPSSHASPLAVPNTVWVAWRLVVSVCSCWRARTRSHALHLGGAYKKCPDRRVESRWQSTGVGER